MLNKKYGYLKNSELCPLCLNSDAHILYISKRKNLERNYYKCNLCFLVFVPDYFHISPDKQKLRYLEHENDINSEGYKSFLFPDSLSRSRNYSQSKKQIDSFIKKKISDAKRNLMISEFGEKKYNEFYCCSR